MVRTYAGLALALMIFVAAPDGARGASASGDSARVERTITDEQRRELERIGTLGYTIGGGPAPRASGVTVHEDEAYEGYTVYVSADFPGAYLVDMDGRVLHTWREEGSEHWTRVWVYPDGSALGVSAYPGRLIKLDADSQSLWTYGDDDLRAHHDAVVEPDSTIYVLMRRGQVLEWLRAAPLLEDMICLLAPSGKLVREVACLSVPRAFRGTDYEEWVTAPGFGSKQADPFHTNTVEVLDGTVPHPAFREGNILITIRNMDCLAVLDGDSGKVVWANRGRWQRPHEARVTREGTLVIFDNRKFEGQSRVVEYDVVADRIVWTYTHPDFFSRGSGAQQMLENGNILITESQKGRIFEVTREGRVVWEYWNPRRIETGAIVRVTRAFRLPPDYFEGPFKHRLIEAAEEE
ncbi:MAG: PQQ-binding-like beta-propeller repeat protein [Candidatus Eisenbacteria bacterium]|nr:PQQ-binding-like beta-propeller repeat protein [Candidatus Eisenbacteria bacterium]